MQLSLGDVISIATRYAGRSDYSASEVSLYANLALTEVSSRLHFKPKEAFALSNVTGTGDERRIEVPQDFERRLAGPRAPWQLGEPDQTALVRVPRHVFEAARASYGEAVSLREDEGSTVLVTRYSGERQLAGWILSLGEEAEVLAPDSLVERTVDGLERLVTTHDGEPS